MPLITLPSAQEGPITNVSIGLSKPHRDALSAAGQPIPNFVTGRFLVDTGASSTCVDPDLVKPLGLLPSGAVNIKTPSTGAAAHTCYTYDVAFFIPPTTMGDLGHFIDPMAVLETHLRSQGIDGLIGRDVLSKCVLVMNGPMNVYTLAY